jgi:hypothetical protein
MNRIHSSILAAVLLGAIAVPAFAADAPPRVERREARQEHRIKQGEKSGQLTPREARKAERGQRHVARMERRMGRDGRYTPRERARLNHAQNVQSRRIYRMKHNRRHRHQG